MRAEDDEMSNALMSDMADALRSAGLGSMLGTEEVESEPEPSPDVAEEMQTQDPIWYIRQEYQILIAFYFLPSHLFERKK